MGTITATATPVKVSNIQAAITVDIKSDDPLDHIIWKFSVVKNQGGVALPTTGGERYELMNTRTVPTNIQPDQILFDCNTCNIFSDAATLFQTDIFYLDSQNRKGSCHNWTELPSGYQTIYKYSPPLTNTVNVQYSIDIDYYVWQGLTEFYYDGSVEWTTVTLNVSYEVQNDSKINNDVFLHYLHAGALAKSAFSVKPYELLPGAVDGSVFVDPLGPNYSPGTGPGTTLNKDSYFPSSQSNDGGFTWSTLPSFDLYSGAALKSAFSLPFTLSAESPVQEFIVSSNNLSGSMVTAIISKHPNSVINVKGENCLTSPSGTWYCSYSHVVSVFANSLYFDSNESSKWKDYLPPGEQFYLNIFPYNGTWGTGGATVYVGSTPRQKVVNRPYPAQAESTSWSLPSGWTQQDWPLLSQTQTLNGYGSVSIIPANSGIAYAIPAALMSQLRVSSGILIGVEGGGSTMISKYPGNRNPSLDGWSKLPRYYMFTKNGVRQNPTDTTLLSSCEWLEENTTYYLNVFNARSSDIAPQLKFISVL